MTHSFSARTEHVARKRQVCEYCQSDIPPGTSHLKIAGKYDGDFYAVRGHLDCEKLWRALFEYLSPDGDGMQFNLCDELTSCCTANEAQETLDAVRGHYPHAVNRLEFSLRQWLVEE